MGRVGRGLLRYLCGIAAGVALLSGTTAPTRADEPHAVIYTVWLPSSYARPGVVPGNIATILYVSSDKPKAPMATERLPMVVGVPWVRLVLLDNPQRARVGGSTLNIGGNQGPVGCSIQIDGDEVARMEETSYNHYCSAEG